MDSLNKRLRHIRRAKDLSQTELAHLAGVNRATVSRIETGDSNDIRRETLTGLAAALEVSTDYLLFGEVAEVGKAHQAAGRIA